ncbi:hypothetical protein ADIMK_1747 [Marinobacterium lacunae]|uniref:ChrR-like cupin domain-containing protein n=1 Tax=Marinobacterium lacunae TaxID=1232683 RepID=A0A081FZQ7_9GAMM|nr:ChrR family anti-sigma-E factor [Marinobacterium lacunae]KEA64012.1 hypothetical protein ADIMK_1747 [Marinobacterium lacunae]
MNISHHFDDATLMAYASGSMPQGMALLVACHLQWCASCREKVSLNEAVGGTLLERVKPAALDAGALDRLMDRLDEPDVPAAESESVEYADPEVPSPLGSLLGCSLNGLAWRRLGYGVHQYDLGLSGPGATRLLRIAPGVSVPHHGHRGSELTLILRGSYSDELGRFRVGDVADVDAEIDHQPIVDTDQECICLIATDAPLKFSGLVGRLIQPFVRL